MSDWENLDEEVQQVDQVAKLKLELAKVSRQLFEVKHKRADYIAAVHEAVEGAIAQIQIRPVPKPRPIGKRSGKPEVAVAMLSDMQTGKVTPTYNSDVCRERVMAYAEKIVKLTNIQRADHPVDHVRVVLLGDVLEGCDIFPGQQWLIDSTLYAQIFETTPTIIADFIRYLLANFETVTVEAVDGNHGRIGRKGQYGPEDNADKMVYRVTKLLLQNEPRVTWNITDYKGERSWYRIMQIGNYRAMLIHGDQIRGSMGYPFYGLGKKVHAWASGGLGEEDSSFHDLYLGHWHQLALVPMNKRKVWQNGSIESTNTFAAETLAAQSDPSQWLLFVDPEGARVTASYAVDLT